MAEQCPDENELLDLVSGGRPPPEVARHVAGCATCSLVLADAFGAHEETLAPGSTLGRYRIGNQIGRGGVGTVYEAHDELLDRQVAIKILRRSSPDARARLLREARLIARLDHRNVVSIYDAGESGPTLYFAMELVRGHSLRDLATAKAKAKAPRRELLRALRDAGRGLAAAHRAGIVHRDFKPANVLVSDSGRAVVVDFGLAAADLHVSELPVADGTQRIDDRLTMTGQVFGTPAYMAPEQIAGRTTDARSDQFAFCASMVHVLTGALPFRGSNLGELHAAIERGAFDERVLAQLPLAIRRVVARGLAADPDRRFPSLDALLAQLDSRPRVVIGVVAVVVAGIAATGGYLAHGSSASTASDPCVVAAGRANELWPGRAPHPMPSAATAALDAWTAEWRSERTAVCRRAGHAGEDPHVDREAFCLDSALVELGAVLDVIAAEPATARRAASALPQLSRCRGGKPAIISEPRATRATRLRRRLEVLAGIEKRGGLKMTVLVGTDGTHNRLYVLSLPEATVVDVAPIPYAGDLWELPSHGRDEAYSFDRKRDVLVTLDLHTGKVVRTLPVADDIRINGRALATSPQGALVGLFRERTFATLDPQTGRTTEIAALDAGHQVEAMTYCPDHTLYAAGTDTQGNAKGRTLYRLDLARGAVTEIGPIGDNAIDIDTLACDGTLLYGVDAINTDTNELVAIDPRNGERVSIATLPGATNGLLIMPR